MEEFVHVMDFKYPFSFGYQQASLSLEKIYAFLLLYVTIKL
jgi:hypothetical protein